MPSLEHLEAIEGCLVEEFLGATEALYRISIELLLLCPDRSRDSASE